MFRINLKYIILVLASFIFAILMGGRLPYTIFYALILLLILAIINILIQKITMGVSITVENDNCFTGDSIKIITIINSFSLIPAAYYLVSLENLYRNNNTYEDDVISLYCKSKKVFSNNISFEISGIYNFSSINIIFTDLFSIVTYKIKYKNKSTLKVYPKVLDINDEYFSDEYYIDKCSIVEDSSNIMDYRKYHTGDSLKKVHWKLSAKYNELYVKNYFESESKEFYVLLNMNCNKLTETFDKIIEERMIECCIAITNYFITNKYKVNMCINNLDDNNFSICNERTFNQLLEYFLQFKSKGNDNFEKFIIKNIKNINKGSYIGIISIKVNHKLLEQIMYLLNLGYSIYVFYYEFEESYNGNFEKSNIHFIKFEEVMKR